ncbi:MULTISPECIES: hypothetical protein [unclassified Micromonospora]|uniref:hypothetical protein n=1 Tax=unclassified Micromonospora TaxID=2617518 RepID=UPI003A84B099
MSETVKRAFRYHLGHLLAATAVNVIRIDAWLTDTALGRTRTSHLTQLDLAG